MNRQELTQQLLIAMVTGCAIEIAAMTEESLASLVADAEYLAGRICEETTGGDPGDLPEYVPEWLRQESAQ